ncbi:MAG: 5'/3'-nucleotidase SurE [Epsilonproteobacteria bacterium]|nr:MAG: 5'/3'-nucleotidase SurE [Campylobacterota bacterium]RLA64941.1 MAG: 5'/3'-nucleotidase SurE [Campylobacterota bacterium]
MKILISNDDGVYAEGLRVLYEAVKDLGDVMVIAPLVERSTTGHSLSLDNPLRVVEVEENYFGVSGFPADCTLFGIGHQFLKTFGRPDLVISGINRGANLGQDIYYSGTVAAAREAAFHDIPGIAISTASHFGHPSGNEEYQTAANFIRKILLNDVSKILDPLTLININVPNITEEKVEGVSLTRLGLRKYSEKIAERKDFRENPYYWIVGHYEGVELGEGTDTGAIENNKISITPLNLLHSGPDKIPQWKKFIEEI